MKFLLFSEHSLIHKITGPCISLAQRILQCYNGLEDTNDKSTCTTVTLMLQPQIIASVTEAVNMRRMVYMDGVLLHGALHFLFLITNKIEPHH